MMADADDDEDGDVGEVVGVGNDEDMQVKGVFGGYSGVRRTVQLKGSEWLISNSENKLCYPLWFLEMNLETGLQVDGESLMRESSMETMLKGLEGLIGFGFVYCY